MRINDDFIYRLKQNNPIDSVMSGYVSLKRRNNGYVCLCPFHSENTPSCTVYSSAEDPHFFCFGCHAGGDVITFIRMAENLDYIEAVRFLADRAGMKMPYDEESEENHRRRERILEINRTAARYFFETLAKSPEGEKGRRYFRDRQLKSATITKYGLGYAPESWDRLRNYMHGKGYSDDELITANLCIKNQKGNIFDSFRDRVIFPIIDRRGNVIAFGGRIIDGSGPKYLNSSDTPVFKKSRELFSMNFAKKSPERRLILAEGYMDVISINQAGFENVVATLGTALTAEQAKVMKSCADEVIISYDSDEAGTAAKHRAINILSEAGLEVRVLQVEDAKDPDEYIKKFGSVRFGQLIDKSKRAADFEFSMNAEGIDLDTDSGKLAYVNKCIPLIADMTDPVEADIYMSRLAEQSGVNRTSIEAKVSGLKGKKAVIAEKNRTRDIVNFTEKRRDDPESIKHMKESNAEKGIIVYLNANPEELSYIESRITPECFVTDLHRRVYEKLAEGMKNSTLFSIMSVQSEFTAAEMGKITAIIENSRGIDINRSVLDDYINTLLAYKDSGAAAGDMSDDEFAERFEKMKKAK